MNGLTFTLAQTSNPAAPQSTASTQPAPRTPKQRQAMREAAILTSVVVLVVVVVGAISLMLLQRHRRRILEQHGLSGRRSRKKKPKTRTDAWAESARRLKTDADHADDDTVDIDPDELGPSDFDSGDRGPDGHDKPKKPSGGRG